MNTARPHTAGRLLGRLFKYLALLAGGFMLVFLLLGWLIRYPAVQTWLVSHTTWILQRQLGAPVYLGEVDIALPMQAVLRQVTLCDEQGADLLKAREIRLNVVNFSLWRYLWYRGEVQRLSLRSLRLYAPSVYLYRRPSDGELNLRFLLDRFRREDSVRQPGRLELDLVSAHLEEGRFVYRDSTTAARDSVFPGFVNFRNLEFDSIAADFSLLYTTDGTFDAQLSQLQGREIGSGLAIDHVSFDLTATQPLPDSSGQSTAPPEIMVRDLSLKSGRTWLHADLRLPERDLGGLVSFGPEYAFEVDLKSDCRLDFALLNYFLRAGSPLTGEVYALGTVSGTYSHIESEDLRIRFGNQSRVRTTFVIDHPLEPERTMLAVRMRRSILAFDEVERLLPAVTFPDFLRAMRLLAVEGRLDGSLRDFQVDMRTKTEVGEVVADLHLQLPPVKPIITYAGELTTTNLDLNELGLTDRQTSRRLNFSGTVNGKGLTLESLDTRFDAVIYDSDLLGYEVDSVRAQVQVAERMVSGFLRGRDAEGWAEGRVDIDYAQQPGRLKADGTVSNLNLKRYDLYPEPVRISSSYHVNLRGDSLDNYLGDVRFAGTRLEHLRDSLSLDIPAFWVNVSEPRPGLRYLNLKSSFLQADVMGNYTFSRGIALTRRLVEEARLYFTNNDSLTAAYYAEKPADSLALDAKVALAAGDSLNEVLAFFGQPFYFSPNSLLVCDLRYDSTEQVYAVFSADSAGYGPALFRQPRVEANVVKQAGINELNILGGVYSRQLGIGPRFTLDSLSLDLEGSDNFFTSDLKAYQLDADGQLRFVLETWLDPDGVVRSVVNPDTSHLVLQGDTLRVAEGDSILYSKEELYVRNLLIQSGSRYFRIHGTVSEDPRSRLTFSLAQLDMGFFSEIYPLSYEPGGKLNAELELRNLLQRPEVELFSRVDSFSLDTYPYGTVHLNASWADAFSSVIVRGRLMGEAHDTTLALAGTYSLSDTVSPLDFRVTTTKGFPLDYISPFVKEQIYGISGMVALERFAIRGRPDKLDIAGTGYFREAGFGVAYFKTEYTFAGRIEFENNLIHFPRIRLYDRHRNHADFHGDIYHEGLTDFEFDLQMDSVRNFLVMDTRKQDNPYYYGTIYIKDGLADITGNLEELNVQAIASSGPNSRLRIPVTDYTDMGRPDYIQFVGEKIAADPTFNTGLKGFNLSLTTIATEDAEVELIFDERVGDIIRGRGRGVITVNINETGEFSMVGKYEIRQGDYLFTAQNVLNKRFEVKQGGTITWNGDPYAAIIQLDAVYPLYADIKDLLQETKTVRAPVNVLMHMEGLLMKPTISLSIELPNLRGQDAERAMAYLRSIRFDEQELNKQVFSLMVFNRFAPMGGDLGGGLASTGVTTSISELLSNQLNYLLSQVVGDKVNINVNTSNFQDVNLLVSARLFNDRVTIERDGTLIQGGDDSHLAIGNIRMIIRLLPSGDAYTGDRVRPSELVLEVFTRESYSAAAQNNTGTTNQTGLGVFYRKDFDRLGELLRRQ